MAQKTQQGLMKNQPVKLQDLKKKCYRAVESTTPSSINWDKTIGEGTYGLILPTIHEPNKWVVKIADKTGSCTTMDHEKNLQHSAVEALNNFKQTYPNLPIVCPEVADFAHTDNCCWYYMQRIYNPRDFNKLVHTTIDYPTQTTTKWSGIYPSPARLSKIIKSLQNTDINSIEYAAYLNGIIFGILHYMSKQTGQDLEIVLGKIAGNNDIKIIFYDFDKSSFTHDMDEKVKIRALFNSLQSAYSTSKGILGYMFTTGYKAVAGMSGPEDLKIANKVIAKLEFIEEDTGEVAEPYVPSALAAPQGPTIAPVDGGGKKLKSKTKKRRRRKKRRTRKTKRNKRKRKRKTKRRKRGGEKAELNACIKKCNDAEEERKKQKQMERKAREKELMKRTYAMGYQGAIAAHEKRQRDRLNPITGRAAAMAALKKEATRPDRLFGGGKRRR